MFKNIILALSLTVFSIGGAQAEAEKKKVCEVQKDSKGTEKEVCKTIKIHKKLEGASAPVSASAPASVPVKK